MHEELYDDLVDKLSLQTGLRFGHLNVNGLKSKLTEITLMVCTIKLDVLAITETHLSNEITDVEINIEGYNILRSDRKDGRKGGGTLIYYNKDINAVESNCCCYDFESTWLDILFNNQRILIGCICRPPNNNKFLTNFEKALDIICYKRKNILLLGDFNIDYNKKKLHLNK